MSKKKEDNRDVFEKALEGIKREPYGFAGLAGGAVAGALLPGKFKRRIGNMTTEQTRASKALYGAGVGGAAGFAADHYTGNHSSKKRRK